MKITTPKILMPGLSAMPTHRGILAVDLGYEADPIAWTPETVEAKMLELGCYRKPDGFWFKSWKWLKDFERNFDAQQGQPVFGCMDTQRPRLRDPLYFMDMDESSNLVQRERGRLSVWIEPDSQPADLPEGCESVTRRFGAGMDVSEGVGASNSTIEVFCRDNSEQAAELADNRITPSELGRFAAAVGRWYNESLICCVRKMHGLTTLRVLADECEYSNLWHHRIADGIVEKAAHKLGWAKGEATDPLLFGRWMDVLEKDQTILHGLACWQEHEQYIYNERGEIVFQRLAHLPREVRERHADRVVGCALAHQAIRDLPVFKATKKRKLTGIEQQALEWQQKKNSVWG